MANKFYESTMSQKYFPNLVGSVHTLACPISNKCLHDELLCGLDPKYSTSYLIFYSGFINNVNPKGPIHITCVDLNVKNMLTNVDTKYLWFGKCFMNVPSSTELLLAHDLKLEREETFTSYAFGINNTTYYKATLPPLTDSAYTFTPIADDVNFSTQHIHSFSSFYQSTPEPFCAANESSAIMNINFGKMEGTYALKLKNLDNVFIHEDFGKMLGIKSSLTRNDLVENVSQHSG